MRLLLFDAGLPYLTFVLLRAQGISATAALSVGAVFPAAGVVVRYRRRRQLDPFAVFALSIITIGVSLSLLTGDARFVLVKNSVLTAVLGVAFLVSLAASRPIRFHLGREFAT